MNPCLELIDDKFESGQKPHQKIEKYFPRTWHRGCQGKVQDEHHKAIVISFVNLT